MKKTILFLLTLIIASGCKIDSAENSHLNAERLRNYACYLKNSTVKEIPESFITLMGIDEFEALPEAEKHNPLYYSYCQYSTNADGIRYYRNYGYVMVDSKRLMEDTSVWAVRPYVFTCAGSESEGYEWTVAMQKGYDGITYDEDANRLWLEDDTVFFEYSAREKSPDGYTAVIKSKTPMEYSIYRKTYKLSCRVEIFNPDGSLAEWIEIDETDLHEKYSTSRD